MTPETISEAEQENIRRASALLHPQSQLLFITGAGLSADSGLPTYRGIGGLYNDQEATEDGLAIEEALSGDMMVRRPEIPWKHLGRIERACRQATFNRGHQVLAEMERHFPRVWILTQNVDGFHQAAGSRHVIDIHGDIHVLDCTRCGRTQIVPDYGAWEKLPPLCPVCQAVLRPRVVLFNEQLPLDKLSRLHTELQQGFDLVFAIGTSSLFPYISGPVWAAQRAGLPTVEINPQRTILSDSVTVKISLPAAPALDALWNIYRKPSRKS